MTAVAVLPSIHPPWTRRCLNSCRLDPLVVDNTTVNRGVAASWNLGIDRMYQQDADWLILISAAIRFGPAGGLDLADACQQADGDVIVLEADADVGWHLIAFRRAIFDRVGRFDENFHPAYWEDNDFSWRVRCGFGFDPPWWSKIPVDVTDKGPAHGLRFAINNPRSRHVRANPDRSLAYYQSKWGGAPAQERYTLPFGFRPLAWWPQPGRPVRPSLTRPPIVAGRAAPA